MENNVEIHFMCLLSIAISSSMKCLFMSFAHFLLELFVFSLLSLKSPLYTLDITPLLGIEFENTGWVKSRFTVVPMENNTIINK